MRHIGNLPNASQAELFKNYLYARGIQSELERDGESSWMIWVSAEDQLENARGLLEHFQQNPSAPEFTREAATAEQMRQAEAKDYAAYRKRFKDSRQLFPQTRSYGAGVLTYALIVVCVLVALWTNFGHDESRLQSLFISYPAPGFTGFLAQVRAGELWRLFTPALIHFNFLHLLFDMYWLFYLGNMIESRQGHLHFILLTLALAVGSNLAQYIYAGPFFGGMSGVDYGLFGYVWLRGKFDPASGLYINRQTVVLMVVWFIACFSGAFGPIANAAHGAGLGLGAAYGWLSAEIARRKR